MLVKVKVKWFHYRPGVDQRVGRGIALLLHDRGTRRWWVVSSKPRPHFTPGQDPVPVLQKAGWDPGPVWTGVENLFPTGIRSWTVQPVLSRYTDWAGPQTRYLSYRRLGGPQGRSGRAENLVPTAIRSRTVQPVVSRYTDWATGPTWNISSNANIMK